jgi:uncharacterized membrane protein (DUF485 family)
MEEFYRVTSRLTQEIAYLISMITLTLSISIFCFLIDAKPDWQEERTVRAAAKGLGCLIAFGVLVMAFFSIFETHSATTSWAFRTGELVPVATETDKGSHEILVTYRQKSWWRWKTNGEWETRLNQNGEWEYLDGSKWQPVPLEVYNSSSDDRAMEMDNRGWHEQ